MLDVKYRNRKIDKEFIHGRIKDRAKPAGRLAAAREIPVDTVGDHGEQNSGNAEGGAFE